MGKKIIVAGAGHGGITAAALLAEKGFDVTVYERGQKGKLGYDWTDIFDPKALDAVGCPWPSEDKFEWKTDMTFWAPGINPTHKIRQRVPNDVNEMEIKMERSDIYDLLIGFAESKGVKFEYEVTITGPLMEKDRVVGIATDKGDFYADMVIDAAGCESPVRVHLPDYLGIQKHAKWGEKFYVWREFFDLPVDIKDVDDLYKVVLFPDKESVGICWIASEATETESHSDLLIGRMDRFTAEDAAATAERYRKDNPQLGREHKRGGYFTLIPVRQPIAIMVADGYAAIGDSAFMTVPIIGSGIGNAIKNSKILADVIASDKTETYSASVLYHYQYEYFNKMGRNIAPLALAKLLLTRVSQDEITYALDNGILTYHEMTITANHTSIGKFIQFDPNLPKRGLALLKNPGLLKKAAPVVLDMIQYYILSFQIPKTYSLEGLKAWAAKYNNIFERRLPKDKVAADLATYKE